MVLTLLYNLFYEDEYNLAKDAYIFLIKKKEELNSKDANKYKEIIKRLNIQIYSLCYTYGLNQNV
jgi:hypothetical protein